jgi:hypothetical protein
LLLDLFLQRAQILDHGPVGDGLLALHLPEPLVRAPHGVLQPRNLLAEALLFQTVQRHAILGGGGKVLVLGGHDVDPGGADGVGALRGDHGVGVQVGHAGGEAGDDGVLVAVHDCLLPEALLRLREAQLGERLERVVVHVVGQVGRLQAGQDVLLRVGEDAGGEGEVGCGGLEAARGGARAAVGELREEGGEVEEHVEELVPEAAARDGTARVVAEDGPPGELDVDLTTIQSATRGGGLHRGKTDICGELGSDPDQLRRVRHELRGAAGVRLLDVDGGVAQPVD